MNKQEAADKQRKLQMLKDKQRAKNVLVELQQRSNFKLEVSSIHKLAVTKVSYE